MVYTVAGRFPALTRSIGVLRLVRRRIARRISYGLLARERWPVPVLAVEGASLVAMPKGDAPKEHDDPGQELEILGVHGSILASVETEHGQCPDI